MSAQVVQPAMSRAVVACLLALAGTISLLSFMAYVRLRDRQREHQLAVQYIPSACAMADRDRGLSDADHQRCLEDQRGCYYSLEDPAPYFHAIDCTARYSRAICHWP